MLSGFHPTRKRVVFTPQFITERVIQQILLIFIMKYDEQLQGIFQK